MGMHSSPTGELFLTDVRVGRDRLIGETEDVPPAAARAPRTRSRWSARAWPPWRSASSSSASSCASQYAKDRVQFGKPIGEFQLIQLKLANMEVARLNVQNLVFRHIEMAAAGKGLTLAEASAMKLYSARAAIEVALEAVQLFGGNGYMAEFQVEQLARDAKVLQIYAGTDEIQITHIARVLLRGDASLRPRAAVAAGTLSGLPSTLWAFVRGEPLLGAARAAGALLGRPTLARGMVAHAALTCLWTAVLVPALPTRRRAGLGRGGGRGDPPGRHGGDRPSCAACARPRAGSAARRPPCVRRPRGRRSAVHSRHHWG